MARVKRSVHAKKKRREMLEQAKGYRGLQKHTYQRAKEQVMKSLTYASRDRRTRKRDFRRLWIIRINAGARLNGLSYNQFIHGLKLAEIELTEVNAQVEQARQLAEKARRDMERGERLYNDQVISLEQLQDLRTQASVAQAQLNGAEFNRGYAVITAPGDGVILRKLAEEDR